MKLNTFVMMCITSLLSITSILNGQNHSTESQPVGVVVGSASWYGKEEQGKNMANGRLFDRFKFSAASRTLPLGTRIKVLNIAKHRSMVLSITDRGPWIKSRLIDLSEAAAKFLDCKNLCTVAYLIQEEP